MRGKSIEVQTPRRNNEREEIPFDRYIGHTKRFLSLFSMWQLDRNSSRFSKRLVILNAAVLLTSNFILGLSELIKLESAQDLRSVASGIGSFWLHFVGFFKWLYFVWNIREVMDLVGQLEECYILSLGMRESEEGSFRLLKEMNDARKSSVRFMYVWCLLVTYGIIHWCLNPVFYELSRSVPSNGSLAGDVRLLPYEAWIPWNTAGSLGYGCAYVFEFLGGFASCIGSVSYDIFYLSMIMMICAQLRFLNYSLAEKGTEKNSIKPKELTCSFLERKLIRGKIHHNAILRFLASLERVTSPVMFVQCVGTIGILCLVSFEATTVKLEGDMNSLIRIWSMLEYIVDCFAQLFYFCLYASEVTALGLEVCDSTYSCGWESAAPVSDGNELSVVSSKPGNRGNKGLRFLVCEITTRAQRPFQLTGGPFYVLSLETFRAVVAVAFSYSTVLRGLGEKSQ